MSTRGLTPTLLVMLEILAKREYVTTDALIIGVYQDGDEPACGAERTIHVHVSRLRKALIPYGIDVRNLCGGGGSTANYSIPPGQRKRAVFLARNYYRILSGDAALDEASNV